MTTLYDSIRTSRNLHAAWRHVRKSASASLNKEQRGYASEFEHHHQRHINRTYRQLKSETFIFDPVKGIAIDKEKREKQGKRARPIAIGTMRNRLVERAMLQVLQPTESTDSSDPNSKVRLVIDPRLGGLNEVNRSKFGVGGLVAPYGGVRPAIELALNAMKAGARYYFRSDIKSFFTKIPTQTVIDRIHTETGDTKLANLISNALHISLANADELGPDKELFPTKGIGVAQGSPLSAFASNVLLCDFDTELNSKCVTTIRYVDDILILAEDENQLSEAVELAQLRLQRMNLELYAPKIATKEKADTGLCTDGIMFLGCFLQPKRCIPHRNSRKKIVSEVRINFDDSKRRISKFLTGEGELDEQFTYASTLSKAAKKVSGWTHSFSFCTASEAFLELDKDLSGLVQEYNTQVRRLITQNVGANSPKALQIMGMPSSQELYNKIAPKKAIRPFEAK